MATPYTRAEGWRIWTSFFLAGLYAPLAVRYLVAREEWTAGLGRSGLPPAPPSQRGGLVLLLSVALPIVLVLVLGLVISALDVRPRIVGAEGHVVGWDALQTVHRFGWFNLLIGGLYPALVLLGRPSEARLHDLLVRVTGGDARVLRIFEAGRLWRRLVALTALLPLGVLCVMARALVDHGWVSHLAPLALAYLVSVVVAAWCVSWVVLQPALRFREALFHRS